MFSVHNHLLHIAVAGGDVQVGLTACNRRNDQGRNTTAESTDGVSLRHPSRRNILEAAYSFVLGKRFLCLTRRFLCKGCLPRMPVS